MSAFDFNLLTQGGPMMWVLLALGAIGLVLFIERTLFLHRGQIRSTDFINGIKNILAKRRLVEALTVCEETPGPVAAVVKAALLHADDDSAEAMRFHVQGGGRGSNCPPLERRGWARSRRLPRWPRWRACSGRSWGWRPPISLFRKAETTRRPARWRAG